MFALFEQRSRMHLNSVPGCVETEWVAVLCLQVHLLGFSWANSDEGKMRSTFGVGHKDFGHFLDLQMVAQGLGYHGFGLARLARQVRKPQP
jgi:hypothetical protein